MKRFFGIFGWLLDSLDSSWQLWLALGSSTIFGKGSLFVCFLLLLCFYCLCIVCLLPLLVLFCFQFLVFCFDLLVFPSALLLCRVC